VGMQTVTGAVRRVAKPAPEKAVPLRDLRTGDKVGEVCLPSEVFSQPLRVDILHRYVPPHLHRIPRRLPG